MYIDKFCEKRIINKVFKSMTKGGVCMYVTINLAYFFFLIFLGTFIWELKNSESKHEPLIIIIVSNIVFLLVTLFVIDNLLNNLFLFCIIVVALNSLLMMMLNLFSNFKFDVKATKSFFKENYLRLSARLGVLSVILFVIFTIILLFVYMYKPSNIYSNFINVMSLIGTIATLLSVLPLLLSFLKENK